MFLLLITENVILPQFFLYVEVFVLYLTFKETRSRHVIICFIWQQEPHRTNKSRSTFCEQNQTTPSVNDKEGYNSDESDMVSCIALLSCYSNVHVWCLCVFITASSIYLYRLLLSSPSFVYWQHYCDWNKDHRVTGVYIMPKLNYVNHSKCV